MKTLITIIAMLFITMVANAQIGKQISTDNELKENFFKDSEHIKIEDLPNFLKNHFSGHPDENFRKFMHSQPDDNGSSILKFRRYIGDVLVFSDFIMIDIGEDGTQTGVGGVYTEGFDTINLKPLISLEEATELAKQEGLKVREYTEPDMGGFTKQKTKETMEKEALTKKIVSTKYNALEIITEKAFHYLCYDFYVSTNTEFGRRILIDALTGKVLRNESTVKN